MADVLTIRSGNVSRAARFAPTLGLAAAGLGVVIGIASSPVWGGALTLLGAAVVTWAALAPKTSVRFHRRARTIERVRGPEAGPIGTFGDFKGVEVVGRVNEEKLEGTALHQVHRTYPMNDLMEFDVCMVGDADPVPVATFKTKRRAIEVQERIIDFGGWTFQSTSVPDSKRLL